MYLSIKVNNNSPKRSLLDMLLKAASTLKSILFIIIPIVLKFYKNLSSCIYLFISFSSHSFSNYEQLLDSNKFLL